MQNLVVCYGNYFMRQAQVNIVPGHKAAEIAQSSGYIWSQHACKPFKQPFVCL